MLVMVAIRVLALLLAVEVSGLAHAASDGYAAFAGSAQHENGDCGGDQDHECAPGCPNCHCWHAGLPGSPAAPDCALTPPTSASVDQIGFVPYAAMAPPGADPESVYRPPRPADLSR